MRTQSELPESTFRVPFGPVLPLVAVAVCVWLLYETAWQELAWGAAGVLGGLLVYIPWSFIRDD